MELYVWRYVVPDPAHYFEQEPYFVLEKCIDTYSSLIWRESFQEPGQFELYLRADAELKKYVQENELLITRSDTRVGMIPGRLVLTTSAEDGDYMTIQGESAEGLMHRRIVMQKASFMSSDYPNAPYILNYLIQENIGAYWYYHRNDTHSPNTLGAWLWCNVIQKGKDDEGLTQTIDLQPYGQNLGAVIEQVCKACGMGFRLPFDPETGRLNYEFYAGKDRSLNQETLPSVVFSSQFNNLGETEYVYDRSALATFALVGGEGDGSSRKEGWRSRWYRQYAGVGLNARSIFVDAKNLSSSTKGIDGNASKYQALLNSTAFDALYAANETHNFSGQALPGGQFRYRRDYFLGDTVSVENAYGIQGTAVVTGVEEVIDETGHKLVPTLSEWRE
jgi:hypothetical protein